MSKGGQSQTQRTEPPKYQLPYLQQGLGESQRLYGAGAPVAGFTPYQQQAQNMVGQRAMNGDPTIIAATNYAQQSLNGGFLGSNPWLDQTFNKTALATQGQLASQFAGAGRNVDQSQGLRAQQLNDLATSVYGGAYENERNRQQGVLPYAQQLGNQSYTDAQALLNVGNQQQGLNQQVLDAPNTALDRYLARIRGGDYGSTTKTGGGGFSGSGALGGAALGSAFGPWGTGIGAILGGLF